ncbi:MAG: GNAT family N-acetyltransferase [Candidatus Saccharimonadales bacterium]
MGEDVNQPEQHEASTGVNIAIQRLTPEDAAEYLRLVHANREFLEADHIYVPEELDDVVFKFDWPTPEGRLDYGIMVNRQLIGEIDLIPQGTQRAEITYWIDQHHRGHGYAALAVERLAEYAFGQLRLLSLRAWVRHDNIASQRTLLRAGFIQTDSSPATGTYGYTLSRPAA